MLALLLLDPNAVVSHDTLIDGLWGEEPPESGRHTLAAYVSRLRRRFEAAGLEAAIESRPGGYRLHCDADEIDVHRFEVLARDGKAALREGDAERALELLDQALSLWRGEPLTDLAAEPFAPREMRRLEELHLAAIEDRIEAGLALGHEVELVAELESLVAGHPYYERLRIQLMTALYRTGRQADALEIYREGRRRLADELGIEPSEELQELQRSILRHDPELGSRPLARPAPAPAADPASGHRPLARRRLWWIVAGLAVTALAGGLPAAFSIERGGPADVPGIAALDPVAATARPLTSLPSAPGQVVSAGGSIWAAQPASGTILRLDPLTGAVLGRVKVGNETGGLAVKDGIVWVASTEAGSIVGVDAATGTASGVIRVGNRPTAIANGYGSIWVVNDHDRTLSRIDVESARIVAVVQTDATGPGIAVGAGGVWVCDESTGRVVLVDPRSNRVASDISVGNGPTALAVDEGSVWVANRIDGTISRIDSGTRGITATIRVGDSPSALVVRHGWIWVANELSKTLIGITSPLEAPRVVSLDGSPTDLSVDGPRMLVSLSGAS